MPSGDHVEVVRTDAEREDTAMRGIIPHLWYDAVAAEAAAFYCDTFPDSRVTMTSSVPGTPSGDTAVVTFELFGQPFMAIDAGAAFRFTPSLSFAVLRPTIAEVDRYAERLAEGGTVLREPAPTAYSERAGWITDRYGLSWQVQLAAEADIDQRIVPTLLFSGAVCGRAEEAVHAYASVFPGSHVDRVVRFGPDAVPDAADDLAYASFRLAGQRFAAMDRTLDHGGFNEAVSLLVSCDDQEELDRYADALSAVPEAERCGWVKDPFGVSWQVTPADLERMLAEGSQEQIARVTEAFLGMARFDLAELRRAYDGQAAAPAS